MTKEAIRRLLRMELRAAEMEVQVIVGRLNRLLDRLWAQVGVRIAEIEL